MSEVPESVWVRWGATAVEIFTEDLRRNNVGQLIEAARGHPQLHGIVPQHGALELLMPGEDGALSARTIRTSALTLMVSFLRACRCRCCIFCPALRGCFPSFIGLCVLVLGGSSVLSHRVCPTRRARGAARPALADDMSPAHVLYGLLWNTACDACPTASLWLAVGPLQVRVSDGWCVRPGCWLATNHALTHVCTLLMAHSPLVLPAPYLAVCSPLQALCWM